MLVLSRKTRQQILIPDFNIRLTVLSVGKNCVQIGIEAPNEVQITRPEVGHRPPESCDQQNPALPCAKFAVFSGI